MSENRGVFWFKIALVLTIWIVGFANAVLHLWNWLMPDLFGLHAITFWQALGLLGLSWLLFSGPRGLTPLGREGNCRGRERSRGMTAEERSKLRNLVESRPAGAVAPPHESC